jgi:hypothetical protein
MRRTTLVATSLSAVLALAACMPSPGQLAMKRVHSTGIEAHQRPGPRQAQAYAESVNVAYRAGGYAKTPPQLQVDVDDAIAVIDSATSRGGPDAPTLIAWKALLLADAGRSDASYAAFQRSMELGPNLMAAQNLAVIYGAANLPGKVAEVCSQAVPIVVDPGDRYTLIERCNTNMNALSEESAMAWATPEVVSWYRQERQHRQEVAAAEADRQAQRQAYENQVVRQAHACADRCNQRGYRCENRCHGDTACENRCVDADHSCVDACAQDGNGQLGQ